MRAVLKAAYNWLRLFGADPRRFVNSARALPEYLANLRRYKRQVKGSPGLFPVVSLFPCLHEKYEASGCARGQYFHHDLLVARRVFAAGPARHLDVGSRVDGFVAHVAAFRPIEVLDIRPLAATVPNISFVQCDLIGELPAHLVECCDSLSSLNALEHFGLGRYGDPIRADGHLLGLRNMHRLLKPRGTLYLAVPIGPQGVAFDAHRIFSLGYLLDIVEPLFEVRRFSYIDDRGDLHDGVGLTPELVNGNCGCEFGCAVIEAVKR